MVVAAAIDAIYKKALGRCPDPGRVRRCRTERNLPLTGWTSFQGARSAPPAALLNDRLDF